MEPVVEVVTETQPLKPWQMIRLWLRAAPRTNLSLFGQVGRADIGHGDLEFLECLLASHQEWTTVLELGTGSGLTTIWLAVAMNFRDGMVWTWDQRRPQPFYMRHWPRGVHFTHGNLYTEPEMTRIRELASKPNTLVICDGGDKTLDMELYAPYLAKGNGVIVHDWSEVDHDRVARLVEENELKSHLEDWAVSCLARYRAWIR